MKSFWILLLVSLAGCHSAPALLPQSRPPVAVVPPVAPPSRDSELEARLQQQRYVIDALLSQQEAWQAQAVPARVPLEPKSVRAVPRKSENPTVPVVERTILQPDSSGIIDLTLLGKKSVDDASNPFVVAPIPTAVREVLVSVQGVLPGPNPSAIVNDRPVEIAESVDSLRLARVDADAVIFACGEHQLRIPLGRPVRVRLP
jgi:hypothetical protein